MTGAAVFVVPMWLAILFGVLGIIQFVQVLLELINLWLEMKLKRQNHD